jgi:gliding motility associated protien GldN
MKKSVILFQLFMMLGFCAFAQPNVPSNIGDPNTQSTPEFLKVREDWKPSLRPDGAIDKVAHIHPVVPWTTIRENDVLWRKRLWRIIDTRVKQNYAFRYPGDDETGGGYFIEILLNAIKKGDVQAFDVLDDRFTAAIKWDDVELKLAGKKDTLPMTGSNGQDSMVITNREFAPENITRFRIKEDVIFDRNLGRAVTRIIGICPVLDKYNEDGEYRSQQPLFWLYYPELRPTLAKYEVYNPDNDVFRISWDDLFEKHKFDSYIYKSSNGNISQEDIKDYKKGVDKLYESEKIKQTLFDKEHDLWVY